MGGTNARRLADEVEAYLDIWGRIITIFSHTNSTFLISLTHRNLLCYSTIGFNNIELGIFDFSILSQIRSKGFSGYKNIIAASSG